mmetsp:Transcript_17284/g.31312  ORF Transcript_17284/g.31312 Transcript_17284/m.31312 type:complete len:99 (-) Transcript_17284:565-861(-)
MDKHAAGTGQYRICIFVVNNEMEITAREALGDCQQHLQKDLSTAIRKMDTDLDSWFWRAEERHQRHYEKERIKKIDGFCERKVEFIFLYGTYRKLAAS